MADLTISKGDFGFDLSFTITESDGTAYNLTPYTITLKVWAKGDPSTLTVDAACTPVIAASGTCKYTVVTGDFNTKGFYNFEIELTKAGAEESTQVYELEVTESG